MASDERQAITGLGAEPPVGSRGRAPGQGVRGQSPLMLKAFCLSQVHVGCKFANFCYLVNCSNMLCG